MQARWRVPLGLAMAVLMTGVAPRLSHSDSYVSDRVIVRFISGAAVSCRDSSVALLGASVVDSIADHAGYVLQLADTSVQSSVATLLGRACVEYAEPDYNAGATLFAAPDDSMFYEEWYLENTGQSGGTVGADIGALRGWGYIHSSPDVIVAVMDKGITITRPDLVNNIFTNTAELSGTTSQDLDINGYAHDIHGWDFYNLDYTQEDNSPTDDPHGTAVASILGAEGNNSIVLAGVTWGVQILPVKIIQHADFAEIHRIADAFHYAVNMRAKIINCSWFTGFSATLDSAVVYARDHGVLVVAGAGNSGVNNDVIHNTYPADLARDNVMSCAFTDRHDQLDGTGYSCPISTAHTNYGATTVHIAAPGCDACGDYPDYPSCGHSGTSVAAPIVSGAAALLWQQNPTWNYMQIKNRLMVTVDTLASTSSTIISKGRLNIGRALDNVKPSPISDLTVELVGRTTVKLTWTDTGDDSTVGTSTAYDLRASSSAISSDSLFNAATQSPIYLGIPGESGTTHCVVVDGLAAGSNHHYSLKIEDPNFNWSNLGADASGTTLGGNHHEEVYCDLPGQPNSAIGSVKPLQWALGTPEPNPASGTTTIRYSVKSSGHVQIQVFDVAGRRVRDLVDEDLAAGDHLISWNGKTDAGTSARAGVYFYRMSARGWKSDGRLVMLSSL